MVLEIDQTLWRLKHANVKADFKHQNTNNMTFVQNQIFQFSYDWRSEEKNYYINIALWQSSWSMAG